MNSVEKHLALIMEWMDKGFEKGAHKAKLDIDELKKKAKELGRDLLIAAAGFTGATLALFKFIEMGSKVIAVDNAFKATLKSAGMLPGALKDIRTATEGTVSDMKLMEETTRALNMGLDPSRITEFWAKAEQISHVTGQNTVDIFDALTMSIQGLVTRQLRHIGIVINEAEAFDKYALSIKKTTADLTFHDKQMALSIALEEEYDKHYRGAGDVSNIVHEGFEKVGASLSNLKDKFFRMLADSPAVEKFLTMLIGKIGGISDSLDQAEPKIKTAVDWVVKFYDGLVNFASDKARPAIANIWEFRDALAALAVTVGTGLFASKIMGIAVALGWVTGGTAAAVAVIAGALAGVTVGLVNAENEMQKTGAAFRGMHGGGMGSYEVFTGKVKAEITSIDELLAKRAMLQMPGVAPLIPGNVGPIAGAVSDKWGPPAYLGEPETTTHPIGYMDPKQKAQLEAQAQYTNKINALRKTQTDYDMEMNQREIDQARQAMEIRMEIYQRGFAAMGQWTQKFYTHGANMGRAFNAMMIAGFGEMAAAYIESKVAGYKMLAMEMAIEAVVNAARGNFVKAGDYLWAAAQYGVLAGAGALAAGAVRSYTQGKAEAISSQQEQQWNAAAGGGDEVTSVAQRKQATGIVNTRPISIVVNSVSYFQAGNMVFGDSEGAFQDLYDAQIRPKIEGDIESGMIQVA